MNPRSTFTASQIQFDPTQYAHPALSEERPLKKVQFVPSDRSSARESRRPLATTQSWHEPTATGQILPVRTSKSEPLSARRSVIGAVAVVPSTPAHPAEKSIYVHIDHKATLALRGQTRRNVEKKNGSDLSVTSKTHRIRSSRDRADSPASSMGTKPSKAYNSLQATFSSSYRPGVADKVMHMPATPKMKLFQHRTQAAAQPVPSHNGVRRRAEEQKSLESASTSTPITRLRISQSHRSRHKSSITPTAVTSSHRRG